MPLPQRDQAVGREPDTAAIDHFALEGTRAVEGVDQAAIDPHVEVRTAVDADGRRGGSQPVDLDGSAMQRMIDRPLVELGEFQ